MCIPVNTIRVSKRDPDYNTPYVKALLTNRYRHVNMVISPMPTNKPVRSTHLQRTIRLRKLVDAPVKQVWSTLERDNSERNGTNRTQRLRIADADKVTEYGAIISRQTQTIMGWIWLVLDYILQLPLLISNLVWL